MASEISKGNKELAARIKDAFAKKGLNLDLDTLEATLSEEACGSCHNIGCRDGCSNGCLSACKTSNR